MTKNERGLLHGMLLDEWGCIIQVIEVFGSLDIVAKLSQDAFRTPLLLLRIKKTFRNIPWRNERARSNHRICRIGKLVTKSQARPSSSSALPPPIFQPPRPVNCPCGILWSISSGRLYVHRKRVVCLRGDDLPNRTKGDRGSMPRRTKEAPAYG